MRCALFALLLVGCTNPDELVPLSGTVRSSGSVEGQMVRLLRHYQPFQPSTGQCQSAEATPFEETQAGAEGEFRFELFRIEAQSFSGFGSYCFRVDTTFPSGSVAWSDLSGLFTETRLAAFYDWRAAPRLEGDVLRFEPAVAAAEDGGESLDHRAQVVTSDGGTVWGAGDRRLSRFETLEREPIVLDAARLEDFSATVKLRARFYSFELVPYGVSRRSTPPVELRSGDELAVAGSHVPLSRGLPCAGFASPCPLTDADLTMVDAGLREEVTLELPSAAVLSSVVLRGAEVASRTFTLVLTTEDGGVVLSTSEPFDAWAFETGRSEIPYIVLADGGYAGTSIEYLVVSLDAGVPVQRVTLRFPNGLLRIAELSLFE